MLESETSEIAERLLVDPETVILFVCMNGRTRSKVAAREADALGYHRSRVLGIKDFSISLQEKEDALDQAQIIVAIGADVEAEIRQLNLGLQKPILTIHIANHEHVVSRLGTPDQRTQIGEVIRRRLLEVGFVDCSELS